MTVYFFDSSALIKRYVSETGTAWVRATVSPRAEHTILIAQVTPVEMISALARRKREARVSAHVMQAARLLIDRHVRREYNIVQLSERVVQRAEDLLDAHYLRPYDAIQLASALESNRRLAAAGFPPLIFVSIDERLLVAAGSEGLPNKNLNRSQ